MWLKLSWEKTVGMIEGLANTRPDFEGGIESPMKGKVVM